MSEVPLCRWTSAGRTPPCGQYRLIYFTVKGGEGHFSRSLLDWKTSRFQDFQNVVQVAKGFKWTLLVQMKSGSPRWRRFLMSELRMYRL